VRVCVFMCVPKSVCVIVVLKVHVFEKGLGQLWHCLTFNDKIKLQVIHCSTGGLLRPKGPGTNNIKLFMSVICECL
jgi:hypothetical protein